MTQSLNDQSISNKECHFRYGLNFALCHIDLLQKSNVVREHCMIKVLSHIER